VMIIVPSLIIMWFLLGMHYSHKDLDRLMRRLKERLEKKGDDMNLRGLVLEICHSSLTRNYESDEVRDLYMGPVAVIAAFMQDASLFTETVKQTARGFEKNYYYALGEVICLEDHAVLEHEQVFLIVITEALTKCGRLHQIHENLNGFRDGFFRGNPGRSNQIQVSDLRQWLDNLTISCLNELKYAYVEDASTLVRILLECEKGSIRDNVLYQRVRVFVLHFSDWGQFTNALMVESLLHLQHQDCSNKYLESLLQRIMEPTVSNFDLPWYATYIKTRSSRAVDTSQRHIRGQGEKESQCIPAGPIKAFYERVSAREQGTPSRLLGKIQTQASGLSAEQSEFLISFLEEMITVVDVSSIEVRECIQSLVITYITQTIGKEPRKPSDWARPEEERSCYREKCDDCSKMIAFLRHHELQHQKLSFEEFRHVGLYYDMFKYFEVKESCRETFAVTKTLRWWGEQHRDWESRAANTLEALRKLPQAKFKYCLTDQYDEIMDLRVIEVMDGSPESTSQRQYYSKTRSSVPQKRPRDDL
ncbi:MAG: hypothetical protein Q9164_007397, partial [Protoblastenia rupestris]